MLPSPPRFVTFNAELGMPDPARASGQGSPITSAGDEASTSVAVRTMFAAVAPRYDFLNHFLSFGCDIAWRRSTARALRDILKQPASCVVDLCCGTGDLSLCLARESAGRVVGADFCHPMLTLACRKAEGRRSRVNFIEADALHLPFANSSLDAVTIAFGFRNLASYDRGLEEMRRVLKYGGRLAILEFSRVRWPIFGPIFRFYFRRVLPPLGAWISGSEGPYRYLPDSVSLFPDQEALVEKMKSAGFQNVGYKNFIGGIAALHLAEKP
jgi:demethylmenaquinone methyltransferase/2-methoxy-6-polyprenyl-1,4-benzoquinol methylase